MKHRQPTAGRHRLAHAGRHRAPDHPLGHGRHRAPVELAERGRQVAATAALLATVGVSGAGMSRAAPDAERDVVALEARAVAPAAARSADRVPSPGQAAPQLLSVRARAAAAARPAKKVAPKKAVPKWVDPMPAGRTTSCYGQRWGRLHAGVDLAAPAGTPVRAAGAGTVAEAGTWAGGYGISVLIDHGNGYLTHYAHLRRRSVSVGDRVGVGEKLGEEGSTGNSTGPHLHFEVHRARWKNAVEPTAWLADRGVSIPGCGR